MLPMTYAMHKRRLFPILSDFRSAAVVTVYHFMPISLLHVLIKCQFLHLRLMTSKFSNCVIGIG